MLGYDKIFNSAKTHINKPGLESSLSNKRSDLENSERGFIELVLVSYSLEEVMLGKISQSVGLEEDSPFDDLGDFGGDDGNTFDTEESIDSNDNIFDSAGDDPFGDIGSNNEDNQEEKRVALTLDRKEILDRKFDMSRVVRKDFPGYVVKLQSVIISAIDILEKKIVHPDLSQSKLDLVSRYREVLKSIEAYLTIIDSEAYEDIFTTYVSMWSILNTLKKSANKLL